VKRVLILKSYTRKSISRAWAWSSLETKISMSFPNHSLSR
jgi:hypothetical protein